MADDPRDQLYGVDVRPLADGYVPIEAIALIKTVDIDGHETWCSRTSTGVSDGERVGMRQAEATRILHDMANRWEEDDDDAA